MFCVPRLFPESLNTNPEVPVFKFSLDAGTKFPLIFTILQNILHRSVKNLSKSDACWPPSVKTEQLQADPTNFTEKNVSILLSFAAAKINHGGGSEVFEW